MAQNNVCTFVLKIEFFRPILLKDQLFWFKTATVVHFLDAKIEVMRWHRNLAFTLKLNHVNNQGGTRLAGSEK